MVKIQLAVIACAGAITRRYIHGAGTDDPILWYEGAGTNDKRYLHKDERGSVTAITSGTGSVLAINSYDEYGIPAETNLGRFQYTGQTWLPEADLYYYKARIYSPTLGRFLQTDPIGYSDGMNWYNYVGSDPINATDPTGLCDLQIVDYAWYRDLGDGKVGERLGDAGTELTLINCEGGFGQAFAGGLNPNSGGGVGPGIVVTAALQARAGALGRIIKYYFNRPGPHRFSFSRQTRCSADNAFNKLLAAGNSAPGAPKAIEGTRRLTLTGGNPIEQTVNSQNRTILNQTLPGHAFHPGSVSISVNSLNNGGSSINVLGEGTGANPNLNNIIGTLFFENSAFNVGASCGF